MLLEAQFPSQFLVQKPLMLDRHKGASTQMDYSTQMLEMRHSGYRGSVTHLLTDIACRTLMDERMQTLATPEEIIDLPVVWLETDQKFNVVPPAFFVDMRRGFSKMSPEDKSTAMRGNVRLAVETVDWSSAQRLHIFPSLVNKQQLEMVLAGELEELRDLGHGENGDYSLLSNVLSVSQAGEWYARRNAYEIWQVEGELADVAICCLQHWLAYDSLDIDQCVDRANVLMKRASHMDLDKLSADQLTRALDAYARSELSASHLEQRSANGESDIWPEFYLGLTYLIARKMGIDLWEGIILKTFHNEAHYDVHMRLDEKIQWTVRDMESGETMQVLPEGDRLLNEPRPPAWLFMKNLRKQISPEKRFIPPMSSAIVGETVLDKIYMSPYREEYFSLAALVCERQEDSGDVFLPATLASIDAITSYSGSYYAR